MGLGFTGNNHRNNSGRVLYSTDTARPQVGGNNIGYVLKVLSGAIATLVVMGGLVWGMATLLGSKADVSSVKYLEDRVVNVEKNDIRQTVVLEQIKEKLDSIGEKLDKALEKQY